MIHADYQTLLVPALKVERFRLPPEGSGGSPVWVLINCFVCSRREEPSLPDTLSLLHYCGSCGIKAVQ